MRREAVILAGGDGTRAGGEMPKQFVRLLGIPMLWWSVRAFQKCDPDTRITLVMNPGYFDDWDIIFGELPEEDSHINIRLICGGRDRSHSVANGIMGLDADSDTLIAVHDAARPMLTPALAARLWECAAMHGSAVPCCPEVNSLRRLSTGCIAGGNIVPVTDSTEVLDRNGILTVQTPQVFRADMLKDAYDKRSDDKPFTDDASLVQNAGYPVTVCPGEPSNIKVTTPMDFIIAEALLNHLHPEARTSSK